jgi:2-oxoglutarate dehydrogenase E1 component
MHDIQKRRTPKKEKRDGHIDGGSDGRKIADGARSEANGQFAPIFHSETLGYIEQLLFDYRRDPDSVPVEWRKYFDRTLSDGETAHDREPSFRPRGLFQPRRQADNRRASEADGLAVLQERVDQLIRNYRVRGHMAADIDPLDQPRLQPAELDTAFYGFTEADLDRRFSTSWMGGAETGTLREIIDWLRNTYCRWIGVQFMHIDSLHMRHWLQERMESTQNRISLGRAEQLRIFKKLSDAVVFEEFLQKKYIGAKSFSLEGAESLIPLLDMAIERAGEDGVREIVLGMAHRGRLNVLANIMGKSPRQIFREFEDRDPELHRGRGDVKYHLGYSSDWTTAGGKTVHLSLCFNPSHLEFVNPVALGRMRAKQDRFGDSDRRRGMVLLIHGDAAFAGEGVVQESLNLSGLAGYTTGGTIHVIVNNQLGFTTSPAEGRSCTYASDVAKMLQSPIFHVNGENPEAVAQVIRLAMDFRKTFQRDVVIDMYCYRLHGHNEGDEPSFTRPVMYRTIEACKSVHRSYRDHLLELGGLSEDEAERIAEERRQQLEEELAVARRDDYVLTADTLGGVWANYVGGPELEAADVETGVDRDRLASLLEALARLPADFHPHPKAKRGLEARIRMARGEHALDWSAAEALAIATLATEGVPVRLSGQDSARGTFSQRHAVLHDYEDGHTYVPLKHLADDQAAVEICNSPLSEAGVLGFDYGYSLDRPEGLVMWEAQFGDFWNAAQVIVDQFIVSAEEKWHRLSGVVLLLPHGFEGQGPEHSSARLERFLTLAAEDNIQVVNPTTPAQYFHALRRQVLRRWRKPLVVMTPKSLLRHKAVVSSLDECAAGRFQRVISDSRALPQDGVDRVLLCSGKIYYDLLEKREALKRENTAIVRVEQLYPLPIEELRTALAPFADGTRACWVQEEPENMGAWRYLRHRLGNTLFGRLPFEGITRAESASPATGSAKSHKLEQELILTEAFGGV